jgi:hypothetical protein
MLRIVVIILCVFAYVHAGDCLQQLLPYFRTVTSVRMSANGRADNANVHATIGFCNLECYADAYYFPRAGPYLLGCLLAYSFNNWKLARSVLADRLWEQEPSEGELTLPTARWCRGW